MIRDEKKIIEISIDILYKELRNENLSLIQRGLRELNIDILKDELKNIER